MAEYKIVDVEKLDADLTEIADEVRTLTDISDTMTIDEITSNIAQTNADVKSQADLITQIKTALDGKAGSSAAEIGVLIDESGVLDSTEGTATKKVEKLIGLAQWENAWYKASETITNANNLFKGYQGITIPRTNLISATSMGNFMANITDGNEDTYCKAEYIDYYINALKCTGFGYCFRYCTKLKWIVGVNTSSATSVLGMFFKCEALETIQKPLNFSKVTNTGNTFYSCASLKDISFVEETIKISISFNASPLLSAESIQSIIDGLATVTTAQTLTLHADVKAKLTQTQLDTITSKNWNLA